MKKLLFFVPALAAAFFAACSLLPAPPDAAVSASTPAPSAVASTPSPEPQQQKAETELLSDGTARRSDYEKGISFVYPPEMELIEGVLEDAVAVSGGDFCWVIGRNVTESYAVFAPDADGFIGSYMLRDITADLRSLCGGTVSPGEINVLSENIEGRCASAEMTADVSGTVVYIKTIMYISTFSDGTVNYICKTIIAPEGDTEAFNALAQSVISMGAARLK